VDDFVPTHATVMCFLTNTNGTRKHSFLMLF